MIATPVIVATIHISGASAITVTVATRRHRFHRLRVCRCTRSVATDLQGNFAGSAYLPCCCCQSFPVRRLHNQRSIISLPGFALTAHTGLPSVSHAIPTACLQVRRHSVPAATRRRVVSTRHRSQLFMSQQRIVATPVTGRMPGLLYQGLTTWKCWAPASAAITGAKRTASPSITYQPATNATIVIELPRGSLPPSTTPVSLARALPVTTA